MSATHTPIVLTTFTCIFCTIPHDVVDVGKYFADGKRVCKQCAHGGGRNRQQRRALPRSEKCLFWHRRAAPPVLQTTPPMLDSG